MMLYTAPPLERAEVDVVERIDEIRAQVRFVSIEPKAWARLLVPLFLSGEAADGGDEVEGAAALRTPKTDDPAFAGYREALGYVLHLHDDPHFVYHESLLRSLHYMLLSDDPEKDPGRWRSRTICVFGAKMGEVLYDPPPAEHVPELMGELMAGLNEKDDRPAVVRAAMAHLNLVQIHPFKDGNGRMGRALQTLVLVRDEILDPEFSSLEKSIAGDRAGYRESLADLGPAWDPGADARPFVCFCLAAHLRQAERALDDARRMSAVWAEAEREIRRQQLPERMTSALADAAFVGQVDRAAYRRWARVDERTARADLQKLVDRGLLLGSRKKRLLVYQAGSVARNIRGRVWATHPLRRFENPFRC